MSAKRTEFRLPTSQKFSLQANQRSTQLQQLPCSEIKNNSAMSHGQSLLGTKIPWPYPHIYRGIRSSAIPCTPDTEPSYQN